MFGPHPQSQAIPIVDPEVQQQGLEKPPPQFPDHLPDFAAATPSQPTQPKWQTLTNVAHPISSTGHQPVIAMTLLCPVPGSTATPGSVNLQLITGQWITVSAPTCMSPIPAQCWPLEQPSQPQPGTDGHAPGYISPPEHQDRIKGQPPTATTSGVDPCEHWEVSDDEIGDTHTMSLSLSQRELTAMYNKQLIRQQLIGDAVDHSRENVVLTMCTL